MPGDMEDAFLFLSSPISDYVTGILMPVDGGVPAA
jgi:NAD(P)-dependent dehydrogenase (short-subunit alcohol dehydrogenase family)